MMVLDSSFLVAYHNRIDVHHPRAVRTMERLLDDPGRLLLPEYVFLETVTVLMARRDLRTALEVGDLLLEAREVDFVPCSEIDVNDRLVELDGGLADLEVGGFIPANTTEYFRTDV